MLLAGSKENRKLFSIAIHVVENSNHCYRNYLYIFFVYPFPQIFPSGSNCNIGIFDPFFWRCVRSYETVYTIILTLIHPYLSIGLHQCPAATNCFRETGLLCNIQRYFSMLCFLPHLMLCYMNRLVVFSYASVRSILTFVLSLQLYLSYHDGVSVRIAYTVFVR